MSDHEYDAASIRVLASIEHTKRDPDDPVVRWVAEFLDRPLLVASPKSLPDSVVARLQAIADEHPDEECVVAGGLHDAYPPEAARSLECMPEPRARPAGFVEECYPVEDGPGSGRRVELTVRMLVGTARSTVIVDDPVTGRALVHRVVPHGTEADTAADAVAALVREAAHVSRS